MRIVHLIHSEGVYGAERILLYLACEQQRRGHRPVIVSLRDPGTPRTGFESLALAHGLEVDPVRIAPRPTPGVVRTLLHAARTHAPHVLHSHGYKPDILLGFLPRSRRGPMVTTLHGRTHTRRLSRMWLYVKLDERALGRLDGVIVVARQMLRLPGLRHVAADRLRVIENGIPPLPERLAHLARAGVAPVPAELENFIRQRPTLVAIGRLAPEKGFDVLIEAFARARNDTPGRLQLLIIGDGPARAELAGRIAALGLSAEVRLAGFLEGADRLLEHAAGFVMSSITEGMPLALLEALQWHVPIVATAVGSIPDLLEGVQCAQLVDPGCVDALTGALCRLGSAAPPDRSAPPRRTLARMTDEYQAAYEVVV